MFSFAILLTNMGSGQCLLTAGWVLFTGGALSDTINQFEEFDPPAEYDIFME
ncbi:hypothetical protein [Paenibacillus caseinilyticus]|uniref:hypothetical protein n=1 Tax=Paenibacillus caseinilyticus TaxID=3098138 RepID=UPI0022B8AF86|nr:hypothetical protein [Paenibacillus caseinilyticus]MCZ8522599.1 hypothetical protein [Paenibacillus caseinilyticus]